MNDNCNPPPLKIPNHGTPNRDWSALPAGPLAAVSARLPFADVCTAWRSARGPLAPSPPFLLLRRLDATDEDEDEETLSPNCIMLNILNRSFHHFRILPLHDKPCVGSQAGWLIAVDAAAGVLSLYNPLTRRSMQLPSYAPLAVTFFRAGARRPPLEFEDVCESFLFKKVVLSCAPGSGPPPSAIAMLQKYRALICLPAGVRRWRRTGYHTFQDVISWRGQFVGVQFDGAVYKIDVGANGCRFECLDGGGCFRGEWEELFDCWRVTDWSKYLVDLEGSLLQVWRLYDLRKQRTKAVKVMRLGEDGRGWSLVDDLDGHSLFLGTSHSAAFKASEVPGLKDNLVYFTGDWWGMDIMNNRLKKKEWNRDVGVFDMRKGTFEIWPFPLLPSGTSSVWFAPPPSELQNGSFQGRRFVCRQQ